MILNLLKTKDEIFGLDIGYESLKLVQVKRSGSSIELVGSVEVNLTERILEHDSFKNIAKTANLIKEACRKAKPNPIRARKIISALPETFVFSKTIQMPKMSPEEYNKAVPVEAAQYLPIPVEEVYLDYQILIVHPDEPLADILIVASPKKLVDGYVEVTKLAGFELVALETKPIAVGRAIAASMSINGVAIAEIGTEVTRLSIWDNNSIRLVTSVNCGKNQIIESLGDEKSADQSTSAKATISNISDELINSIKYHQNRDYKPSPIKKICLCGSGANIPGVEKLIESATKIPVDIMRPKFSGKATLGPEFITPYGLALRGEYE